MLPKTGKILALDLGTRRTGIALSDVKQRVVFARPEVEHRNNNELLEKVNELIEKESITGILMGLPTKLDGQKTEQTQIVEESAEVLKKTGLPLEFIDERLSTEFAKNLHGFETKDKFVDSRSAQILLETYLF